MDFSESSSFQLKVQTPGGKWSPGPGNDKAGRDYHQLGESSRVHMAKDTKKWKVSLYCPKLDQNNDLYVWLFAAVSPTVSYLKKKKKLNWNLNCNKYSMQFQQKKMQIYRVVKMLLFFILEKHVLTLCIVNWQTEEVNSVK